MRINDLARGTLVILVLVGLVFVLGNSIVNAQEVGSQNVGYPIVEEFDSAVGFTQTDPDVYIANGKVNWTVYRDGGVQYIYRTIPSFSGNVRLTIRGQVNSASNNCRVAAGIGDTAKSGATIAFGYYGGGCEGGGYLIDAGMGHTEYACVFTGSWLWVNPGKPYTAVLTVIDGTGVMEVAGVGSQTGPYAAAGPYDTLFVGLDATNDGDWPSCSGSIDSVTIEPLSSVNRAPNIPSNPVPAAGASGQGLDVDLSWSGGDPDMGDTVTYDAYFGTSATPPKVASDRASTSYDPGTLSSGTTYYWQIVAKDNHDAAASSPVWQFTTGSDVCSADVAVQTVIDNNSIFASINEGVYIAAGDVTNDGSVDLVVTRGNEPGSTGAQTAVFQGNGNTWDAGTLLSGPLYTTADFPIVSPILNDGRNWLVYNDHLTGNSDGRLRAHRYSSTTLAESRTIANSYGWPHAFRPSAGDLDGDGKVELWVSAVYGTFPNPAHHLYRYVWNSSTGSFTGVEIESSSAARPYGFERPLVADFLGDGTQTLVWAPAGDRLELVRYTPGAGVHDHTSTEIASLAALGISDCTGKELCGIRALAAGEFDGQPGTDIALYTFVRQPEQFTVFVISGRTFKVTQVASIPLMRLGPIRMGDLDGDGKAEIYIGATGIGGALDTAGKIFGYDVVNGWREIAFQQGVYWADGATVRRPGTQQDEVLFVGQVNAPSYAGHFHIARLTAASCNQDLLVAVPAVTPEPSDEGSSVTASAGFSDPGPNGAPFTCTVDYGDGSGAQAGTVAGNTCTGPAHTYADNGSYDVTISVADKNGGAGSNVTTHEVNNVAPFVSPIHITPEPPLVAVNNTIHADAEFSEFAILDTHTALWEWGDGSTSPGTVAETDGSGSVTGDHTYTVPDVYTVKLTVTDKDGDSGESIYQYAVVYDPSGGFVTGGGWIDSPAGACQLTEVCQGATGKATFGFVSKYKPSARVPTGNTEFQFRAGDLTFHSSSYDWLVVAGADAKYKGVGTIGGGGTYGFMLTGFDADVNPSDSQTVDGFHIVIWDKTDGDRVVYDNLGNLNIVEDDYRTQPIGGGSIVVHKEKTAVKGAGIGGETGTEEIQMLVFLPLVNH